MPDTKNKTDDFFNTLEKDQAINDPFAASEIAFRDADGNLKVLKEGQVLDLSEGVKDTPVSQKDDIPAKVNSVVLPVDSEIQEIIKETGIKFNDKAIEKRFSNIVSSVLKGARNRVQAREIFAQSMEDGGMGFNDKIIDNILKVIKRKTLINDDAIRDSINSGLSGNLQQEMDKLLKSPVRREYKKSQSFTYEQDLIPKDSSKSEEKKVSQIPSKPAIVPPIIKSKPKPVKVEPEPINMPKPVTGPDPEKPIIQDVRFEPKLTGPIEEIRTMSLSDFRKLEANPLKAIHKILDKINLLEEESFTSKTLGIKAWKDGIINRQYIDLGDESMESKKSMADIIEEKQTANEDVLNEKEVEAIIELNKLLRY